MAHETIALTTELKEPYVRGQSWPTSPDKQRDGAWPHFSQVSQPCVAGYTDNNSLRGVLAQVDPGGVAGFF